MVKYAHWQNKYKTSEKLVVRWLTWSASLRSHTSLSRLAISSSCSVVTFAWSLWSLWETFRICGIVGCCIGYIICIGTGHIWGCGWAGFKSFKASRCSCFSCSVLCLWSASSLANLSFCSCKSLPNCSIFWTIRENLRSLTSLLCATSASIWIWWICWRLILSANWPVTDDTSWCSSKEGSLCFLLWNLFGFSVFFLDFLTTTLNQRTEKICHLQVDQPSVGGAF